MLPSCHCMLPQGSLFSDLFWCNWMNFENIFKSVNLFYCFPLEKLFFWISPIPSLAPIERHQVYLLRHRTVFQLEVRQDLCLIINYFNGDETITRVLTERGQHFSYLPAGVKQGWKCCECASLSHVTDEPSVKRRTLYAGARRADRLSFSRESQEGSCLCVWFGAIERLKFL